MKPNRNQLLNKASTQQQDNISDCDEASLSDQDRNRRSEIKKNMNPYKQTNTQRSRKRIRRNSSVKRINASRHTSSQVEEDETEQSRNMNNQSFHSRHAQFYTPGGSDVDDDYEAYGMTPDGMTPDGFTPGYMDDPAEEDFYDEMIPSIFRNSQNNHLYKPQPLIGINVSEINSIRDLSDRFQVALEKRDIVKKDQTPKSKLLKNKLGAGLLDQIQRSLSLNQQLKIDKDPKQILLNYVKKMERKDVAAMFHRERKDQIQRLLFNVASNAKVPESLPILKQEVIFFEKYIYILSIETNDKDFEQPLIIQHQQDGDKVFKNNEIKVFDIHEEFLVIHRFQVDEFNNYSKQNEIEEKSIRMHQSNIDKLLRKNYEDNNIQKFKILTVNNWKKDQFLKRFGTQSQIQHGLLNEKIKVIQNANMIYFWSMERRGFYKHPESQTIFALQELNLLTFDYEQLTQQIFYKQESPQQLEDRVGTIYKIQPLQLQHEIAINMEFIQTLNTDSCPFLEHKSRTQAREEGFLQQQLVIVKFSKPFMGKSVQSDEFKEKNRVFYNILAYRKNVIKPSISAVVSSIEFDIPQKEGSSRQLEKFQCFDEVLDTWKNYSIMDQMFIIRLPVEEMVDIFVNKSQFIHANIYNGDDSQKEGIIRFVEDHKKQRQENVFELKINEKDSEQNFVLEQTEHEYSRSRIYRIYDIMQSNNFMFMFDQQMKQYLFRRIDPIHEGTILMDVVCPKIINVVPKVGTANEIKQIKVNVDRYGNWHQTEEKLIDYIGDLQDKDTLGSFLMRWITNDKQHKERQAQICINRFFVNAACKQDRFIIWKMSNIQEQGRTMIKIGNVNTDEYPMEKYRENSDESSGFSSDEHEIDCYDCFPLFSFDICDREKSQYKRIINKRNDHMFVTFMRSEEEHKYIDCMNIDGSYYCFSTKWINNDETHKESRLRHTMTRQSTVHRQTLDYKDDHIDKKCLIIQEYALDDQDLQKKTQNKAKQLSRNSFRIHIPRLKFHDDTRKQVPIVVQRQNKDAFGKETIDNQLWLVLFDHASTYLHCQEIQDDLEPQYQIPIIIECPEMSQCIQDVCIAASSEIKCKKSETNDQQGEENIDKENDQKKGIEEKGDAVYWQQYQVAISFSRFNMVKIIEYRIFWYFEDHMFMKAEILHIGCKDIYFQKSLNLSANDDLEIQLISQLDEDNTIVGTELIIDNKNILHLLNSNEELNEISQNPLFNKQGYRIFRDKFDGSYFAIMAYVQLHDQLFDEKSEFYQLLQQEEMIEIMFDAMKSVLNSIPFDPMFPAIDRKNREANRHQSIMFQKMRAGNSVEIFKWFSLVSIMGQNGHLDQLFRVINSDEIPIDFNDMSEDNIFSTLFDRVLKQDYIENYYDNMDNEQTRLDLLKKSGFLLNENQIVQRDFHFNTPLHYLFMNDLQIEEILEYVFANQMTQQSAHKYLNSLVTDFIDRPKKLNCFYKNFLQSNIIDDFGHEEHGSDFLPIKFSQKIKDQDLYKFQKDPLNAYFLDIPSKQFFDPINEIAKQNFKKDVSLEQQQEEEKQLNQLDFDTMRDSKQAENFKNQYYVEFMFIDLRMSFLEDKIQYIQQSMREGKDDIKKRKPNPQSNWSRLQLQELLKQIHKHSGQDVVNMKFLKNLIDHQYEEMTDKWMIRECMAYIFGFYLPFIVQLFSSDPLIVFGANSFCIIISIGLLWFEWIQMQTSGIKAYFYEDPFNIQDELLIFCYFFYFICRVMQLSDHTYDLNYEYYQLVEKWMILVVISLGCVKFLRFMKIFTTVGDFLLLLIECMKRLQVFMFVYFYFIGLFYVSMMALGVEFDSKHEEYHDGFPKMAVVFFAMWRNSLGDISAPEVDKWFKVRENGPEGGFRSILDKQDGFKSWTVVSLIHVVWILNQIMQLIILLNFLITIIGKSYDEVMQMKEYNTYLHRCDLNEEICTLKHYMGWDKDFNCILIVSEIKNNDMSEKDQQMSFLLDIKRNLVAFKDKMTEQLNRQMKHTNDKIQALNDDVDEIKVKMQKEVPAMRQDLKNIKQQNFDIQNEIAQLRDLVAAVGSSSVKSRVELNKDDDDVDEDHFSKLRDVRNNQTNVMQSQISNTQFVDIKSKISNLNEELFDMKGSIIDIKKLLTNPKQKKKFF